MWRELLISFTLLVGVYAWDDDDLEVFDVVEEVNQNFYEFMGISKEASKQEIKAAFRNLTLRLHPDHNSSPDADAQFRNLVSIHNILKDPGKREKYDEVLKNGLPNWRSAVYYYRHVRRMGLAEGAFILFVILTIGQYAVSWAAYFEKIYTAEQILSSRVKKKDKRTGFESGLAEVIDSLPRPSVYNTLPCQIPRAIWWTVTGLPMLFIDLVRQRRKRKEEEIRQKKREEEEELRQERLQAELEASKNARKEARRRRHVLPEREWDRNCLLDPVDEPKEKGRVQPVVKAPSPISGGLWTDDDLAELVRLVKKYPGGTPERWERIAEAMGRSVPEVTHMAHKVKDNPCRREETDVVPEVTKKVKTRKPAEAGAAGWSQDQQAALETALAKYGKRTADRWQRIADSVPEKTQEECMQRCRYLSELLKKNREQKEEENSQENEELPNGTIREEC